MLQQDNLQVNEHKTAATAAAIARLIAPDTQNQVHRST